MRLNSRVDNFKLLEKSIRLKGSTREKLPDRSLSGLEHASCLVIAVGANRLSSRVETSKLSGKHRNFVGRKKVFAEDKSRCGADGKAIL